MKLLLLENLFLKKKKLLKEKNQNISQEIEQEKLLKLLKIEIQMLNILKELIRNMLVLEDQKQHIEMI